MPSLWSSPSLQLFPEASLPKPLPSSHSPGAFPLTGAVVIFCYAAARGQKCRSRRDCQGTLRQSVCPGSPSPHGLSLHDAQGLSQFSILGSSLRAKGVESSWDLPWMGQGNREGPAISERPPARCCGTTGAACSPHPRPSQPCMQGLGAQDTEWQQQ